MARMILPLITGAQTASCTVCDQKADRAVVTDDSCPVIEALCMACTKAVIDIERNANAPLSWDEVADIIRSESTDERADHEPEGPDESMDGDHESALASAGLGTDEDYLHGTPIDDLEIDRWEADN